MKPIKRPGSKAYIHGDKRTTKLRWILLRDKTNCKTDVSYEKNLFTSVFTVVCFCFMFDIIFYLFPRQMDQMKFMGPYYEQFVSI